MPLVAMHNVMSVGIPLHDNSYTTWQSRAQYFTQLKQRVASMPEVKMVGLSTNATPPANGWNNKFELLGQPSAGDQRGSVNWVSNDYFPVLQIPLLQGRLWDEAETPRGARVAVINATMAKRFFPAGDAIGHQLRMPNMKTDSQMALSIPKALAGSRSLALSGTRSTMDWRSRSGRAFTFHTRLLCPGTRRFWCEPKCRPSRFSTTSGGRSKWWTATNRSKVMCAI